MYQRMSQATGRPSISNSFDLESGAGLSATPSRNYGIDADLISKSLENVNNFARRFTEKFPQVFVHESKKSKDIDILNFAKRFTDKQPQVLMYEINANGESDYKNITLRELLHYVNDETIDPDFFNMNARPPSTGPGASVRRSFSVASFAEGAKTSRSRSGSRLPAPIPDLNFPMFAGIAENDNTDNEAAYNVIGELRLRDLRRLDFQFNPNEERSLFIRRHAVMFAIDPIRAVVMADRLLLMVPDGADSLISILDLYMREWVLAKKAVEKLAGNNTNHPHHSNHPNHNVSTTHPTPPHPHHVHSSNTTQDSHVTSGRASTPVSPNEQLALEHLLNSYATMRDGNNNSPTLPPLPSEAPPDRSVLASSRVLSQSASPMHFSDVDTSNINNSNNSNSSNGAEDLFLDLEGRDSPTSEPPPSQHQMMLMRKAILAANDLPFELHAYEALLTTVMVLETQEFNRVNAQVQVILGYFRTGSLLPIEVQEEMRNRKNDLSMMLGRISSARNTINELTEDDEDMALMNLTLLKKKPKLYHHPLVPEILTRHDDIEELLESYLIDMNALVSKIEYVRSQIQNAEELLSLRLNTSRNELLIANTVLAILACCFGLGAYVSGIFGMNLDNTGKLQETKGVFYTVIGTSTSAMCLLFLGMVLYFKNNGMFPRRLALRIKDAMRLQKHSSAH